MRLLCRLLARVKRDDGISLIEVGVGMFVMTIAVTGVVGSMGSGMAIVGHSRQRSVGTAVALEKLERIHNIPFERVALNQQPTHNINAGHPDHQVTTESPPRYEIGGRPPESLIVDTTQGAVPHVEDPVELGGTEFHIYQYVMWVDDAGIIGTQNYKRVIVMTTWKFPVHSGTTNRVVQSTFITSGNIDVPNVTPGPTGSPGPSATPPPFSTSDPAACPGDVTGPAGTMEILSGAGAEVGYTNSTTVQVRMLATDTCPALVAALSNDGTNFVEVTVLETGVSNTISWTIPSGAGPKTITVRYRDGAGNVSPLYTGSVVLDQGPPTTPLNLRIVMITCTGVDRTVSLTWDPSTDSQLLGYRIYKRIKDGPFTFMASTGSPSVSDDHKKSDDMYYKVLAYDRAGNESGDSNVLFVPKNDCS